MDDKTAKQLTRQLKLLNFWITVFGTLILVSFLVIIYLLFKVVTFVQDTSQKINDIQERTQKTLDVESKLCENNSIGNLLKGRSTLCNKQ